MPVCTHLLVEVAEVSATSWSRVYSLPFLIGYVLKSKVE